MFTKRTQKKAIPRPERSEGLLIRERSEPPTSAASIIERERPKEKPREKPPDTLLYMPPEPPPELGASPPAGLPAERRRATTGGVQIFFPVIFRFL